LSHAVQYTVSIHFNSIILFSNGDITYFDTSLDDNQLAGIFILKAGTIILGLYCLGIIK